MENLRCNKRQASCQKEFPREAELSPEVDPQDDGQHDHAQKTNDISGSEHFFSLL
jgi:hypothetical protein